MYTYRARFIKATNDGIDVYIDLGFFMFIKQRVKLFGVKINSVKEKLAIEKITNLLTTYDFFVETISSKRGKVGRCLGNIYYQGSEKKINLAEELIKLDLAEKFNTSE